MTRAVEPWFPALGARVVIGGRNSRAGEHGKLTNSPGKVFNGWTVKLDSGGYAGAQTSDLKAEDSQSRGDDE